MLFVLEAEMKQEQAKLKYHGELIDFHQKMFD